MICKKCGLDISGDCVLTGRPDVEGVCVFCFYGIDSWDSNGQLVTKDQATRYIGWWSKDDLVLVDKIKEILTEFGATSPCRDWRILEGKELKRKQKEVQEHINDFTKWILQTVKGIKGEFK
jgi:hypothetical protein